MRMLQHKTFLRRMPRIRVEEEHDVMVPLYGQKMEEGLDASETEALAEAAAEAVRNETAHPIAFGEPGHFCVREVEPDNAD